VDETIGDRLFEDEHIQQSLDRVIDRLRDYQSDLTEIKPPESDLEQSYESILQSVEQNRGRGLFYPYLSSGLGNGPLVELGDGSVKYDFITGIGVHVLGHSDPKLTRTVLEAALQDTVMQGNLQQNEDSVRLMEELLAVANRQGAGLDHCFLTSSGAMANENALKILFHAREGANRVLAFENGFSGRTLALAQITDKPAYRRGLPETLDVDLIPFYPEHRDGDPGVPLEKLDDHLSRHADDYGCMMMELVQGEGGFYPIEPDFLDGVLDRLEAHNVPVFVDEVQSFGRTSEPFTFQSYGINERVDVVTVGKMTQTCATLFREEWNPEPGLVSQTFTSSTTAIRASRHVLDRLMEGDYFGESGLNMTLHRRVVEELKEVQSRHPELIQGPFGIGAMVGFQVLDGSKDRTKQFLHQLFENGVIGFLAGEDPCRVRFLLPVGALETDHVKRAVQIVEETLVSVAKHS
jgi:4-aminobutyrate aminotransferase-like enzyme